MKFFCNGCNQDRDFDRDYGILVISSKNILSRYCRTCSRPQVSVPDVYWDGKPEIGLADDPITGKPRVFSSKGEKAAYLNERGLQEAGDKIRGSYPTIEGRPQTDSRETVREALHRVSQMGRDRRRQEYQRIIKESRRHA